MTVPDAGSPPPTPANSLRSDSAGGRRRRPGVLGFLIAGAAVLFFFDPATAGFYPPCLFRTFFGLECPGCGSLRAMHQLLHGNFAAAWALNRTVVIALPLAALAGVIGVIRKSLRIG